MTSAASPPVEDLAPHALSLLATARAGVLGTLSVEVAGWPFGSLTPFAVGRDGFPLLVLSDLAEHTRNVRADDRASLFVQDPGSIDRPQSGARMSLLGRVAVLDGDARADARARYVARFAEGAGYLDKLDFRVYTLHVERVRWIGGFGRIAWLDPTSIERKPASDPLLDSVEGIVSHMNTDHAATMALYCAAFRGREGVEARMSGVDAWGIDVIDARTSERFRFDFPTRTTTPDEVRRHLVALARDARAKQSAG